MSDSNNSVDTKADIPEIIKEETKHNIPLAIKFGLPVFLVAISVGGYFTYASFQSSNQLSKSSSDAIFDGDGYPEINALPGDYPIADTEPLVVDMNALPVEAIDDNEVVVKLAESFENLARNVDEITLNISHAKDDRLSLNEKINHKDALLDALNNDLIDLKEELSVLTDMVASQSKKITALSSNAKKKVAKRVVRPPFILLSIDQWGSKNSAVLEISGETSIVNTGDIRSGWRIASINLPDCIKIIRLSDDEETNLCRTGA